MWLITYQRAWAKSTIETSILHRPRTNSNYDCAFIINRTQLKDGRRRDIDDTTTENLETVAGFIDNISVGDAIVKCGAVYVKSWPIAPLVHVVYRRRGRGMAWSCKRQDNYVNMPKHYNKVISPSESRNSRPELIKTKETVKKFTAKDRNEAAHQSTMPLQELQMQ